MRSLNFTPLLAQISLRWSRKPGLPGHLEKPAWNTMKCIISISMEIPNHSSTSDKMSQDVTSMPSNIILLSWEANWYPSPKSASSSEVLESLESLVPPKLSAKLRAKGLWLISLSGLSGLIGGFTSEPNMTARLPLVERVAILLPMAGGSQSGLDGASTIIEGLNVVPRFCGEPQYNFFFLVVFFASSVERRKLFKKAKEGKTNWKKTN